MTKCNTLVNRDLSNERNSYLKKVKKEYNLIYGQRGNNYFNSIQKNEQKPKKVNKKVSFSGDIQYSDWKIRNGIVFDEKKKINLVKRKNLQQLIKQMKMK